jgi:phosphatidate cytidylyltransferase
MVTRESSSAFTPLRRWVASELRMRVASALVLGVVALLAAEQGGWPFALFWLMAGIAVATEWTSISRVEPSCLARTVLTCGLIALTGLYLAGAGVTAWLLAFMATAVCAVAIGRTAPDRLWCLAGLVYAVVITLVPPLVRDHPDLGFVGLLWMFAVVWTSDIAAYFTGRSFGGPKLWPKLSPKKTWSGFLGGLVGGTVAGLLVGMIATRLGRPPVVPPFALVLVSALAAVVSQAGDLAESALKRRFDVKDSGQLIPGHGGAMDRLDGFWAVAALVGIGLAGARLVTG